MKTPGVTRYSIILYFLYCDHMYNKLQSRGWTQYRFTVRWRLYEELTAKSEIDMNSMSQDQMDNAETATWRKLG